MFAAAELGQKMSKEEYKALEPVLRNDLLEAQTELKSAKFPVIILMGGVDAAGKGESVNMLLEWMDPRGIEVNSFGTPTEEAVERPLFWRFWRALPPRGKLGVFYGSWYSMPVLETVAGRMKKSEFDRHVQDILSFEKMQTEDGALFLKFWLHLSKDAQKRRFRELEADPRTAWRVTKQDWNHWGLYDRFISTTEGLLRSTSTGKAPWHIIEGEDWRWRSAQIGRLLLEGLRARLGKQSAKPAPAPAVQLPAVVKRASEKTMISVLDLSLSLKKKDYEKKLLKLQGQMAKLTRATWEKKLSTVITFEGSDAAGKGGAIRRVLAGVDARNYRVIPIAAPTEEERQHPYLWRFWRHLPRAGQMAIFDRTWYGRVLVERVEGFCSEDDWRRAFSEINDFESQLAAHGVAIVKFWLQISKDEQARRFEERKNTPYKRYKITEEDWRNRKKWDQYEVAVNEMVERTSTDIAPWTLVEANDKYWARIKVIQTVCERLEEAL